MSSYALLNERLSTFASQGTKAGALTLTEAAEAAVSVHSQSYGSQMRPVPCKPYIQASSEPVLNLAPKQAVAPQALATHELRKAEPTPKPLAATLSPKVLADVLKFMAVLATSPEARQLMSRTAPEQQQQALPSGNVSQMRMVPPGRG